MNHTRTPVDWLIVIVNVPAMLLALAIEFSWIVKLGEEIRHIRDPNIRLVMTQPILTQAFIIAYLVWITVVTTYIILKRNPQAAAAPSEAQPLTSPAPVKEVVTTATGPSRISPPPVRVEPTRSSSGAAPLPDWAREEADLRKNVPETADQQQAPGVWESLRENK